ncbi:hypothetical protein [Uliginosibacterium sp. H1]|uniref:hypothetical protein n=1 Tax=Uliginosibacterium sp. H1 TaxID=3114757 RepID=UPI002E191B76|nr:hypothetical protein [Uliginosibacterium sp. H1]
MNAILAFINSYSSHRAYASPAEREHEALLAEITHISAREAANDAWISNSSGSVSGSFLSFSGV